MKELSSFLTVERPQHLGKQQPLQVLPLQVLRVQLTLQLSIQLPLILPLREQLFSRKFTIKMILMQISQHAI